MKKDQYKLWVDKAIKELRGESIESINWNINDRISIAPLQFERYESDDSFSSYDISGKWLAGETIEGQSEIEINTALLDALQHGINSPHVRVDEEYNLDLVLNNISSEDIHLVLETSTKKGLINCLEVIDNKEDSNSQIWVPNKNLIYPSHPNLCTIFAESDNYQESDVDLALGDLFAKFIEWLEKDDQHLNQNIVFKIVIGHKFYISVGKLLAVNILWNNIVKALNLTSSMQLDVSVAPINEDIEPESCIIHCTTQCVAAIVGRAHRITLSDVSNMHWENPNFYHQIIRNIHLILDLESDMSAYADIAKGSFYFEHLSQQIAKVSWQELKNKL